MSKEKCDCMWCQNGVTKEEAAKKRAEFIFEIFLISFLKITGFEKDSEKYRIATSIFRGSVNGFFQRSVQDVSDIYEIVFDIVFHTVENFNTHSPSEYKGQVDNIFDCIEHGFEFLKSDVQLSETPVLSGKVTPQMIVDFQLDDVDFPEELKKLYFNQQQNDLSNGLTELMENLGIAIETPKNPNTILH